MARPTAAEAANALEAQSARLKRESLTPGATQRTRRGLRRANDPSAIAEKFETEEAAAVARQIADEEDSPRHEQREAREEREQEAVQGGASWSESDVENVKKRRKELFGW